MRIDSSNPFLHWPRFIARLPRLVRFYIFHWMIGYVIAAIFTGLVIGFDIAGIGHLVLHVEGGWLAALVFFILNGIVFAGVQVSIAIVLFIRE